jgi:hypothetical protein
MDWETSRSVLWSDGTKGEIEDNDRLSISEGLYEQWAQIDAALVTHGVPDEILHNTRMLFVQVARYEGLKRRVRDFYDLDN